MLSEEDKDWARFVAKFLINDLKGILNKYKIADEQIIDVFPVWQGVYVLYALYLGLIPRAYVREVVEEIIKENVKRISERKHRTD